MTFFSPKKHPFYENLRTQFLRHTNQHQHKARYVTKNPYFPGFFRHDNTKEAMHMEIEARAWDTPRHFFWPPNMSPHEMQANEHRQSRKFQQNRISAIPPESVLKPLFL